MFYGDGIAQSVPIGRMSRDTRSQCRAVDIDQAFIFLPSSLSLHRCKQVGPKSMHSTSMDFEIYGQDVVKSSGINLVQFTISNYRPARKPLIKFPVSVAILFA